jgi:hypothetical protein
MNVLKTFSILFLCLFLVLPWGLSAENSSSGAPGEKQTDTVMISSEILGAFSGALAGGATIIFSMTGDVDNDTPPYVDTMSTFPSILIGSYVGIKTAEWAAEKMIKNRNDSFIPFFLKGVFLSSVSGAVILASSIFPLFVTAHYSDTIDFNMNVETNIFTLAGISAAGGGGYGAVFGALIGTVWTSFIYIVLN